MKWVPLILLLATIGCRGIDRLSGHDDSTGTMSSLPVGEPTDTGSIVVNGRFTEWPYGDSYSNPTNFDPVCTGWLAQYGSDGAHAVWTVSKDRDGIRFDVISYEAGASRRGVRVLQPISHWQDLIGRNLEITVTVKTNIVGHVQFAIDAGASDEGRGYKYSAMAQGTEQSEQLTVRFRVPPDANNLWLKIGQTSGFGPQVGWFVVQHAEVRVL